MKHYLLLGAFALLLCLFLSPVETQARHNESEYTYRDGHYFLEVEYKGQIVAKYKVSSSIGADTGSPSGTSWCPTTLTLLSGQDCLNLVATPNTRADGAEAHGHPWYPWNRQFVLCYLFGFNDGFFQGHSFDDVLVVDGVQVGGKKMTDRTFLIETDTNDNGMTNFDEYHGDEFYHATFRAIIKPNRYPLNFVQNNPNAVEDIYWPIDGPVVAEYDSPWGELPVPAKTGYTFLGWHSEPQESPSITRDTLCTGAEIVRDNGDIAYAHWRPNTYLVRFHPNRENGTGEVSGSMGTLSVTYDQMGELSKNLYTKTTLVPSEDEGGEDLVKPSVFRGWSADPYAISASYGDQAKILNLSASDGAVIDLYAIWDDAPKFEVVSYPDRYFTLEEARSGAITESELLRTVEVYDRETNPIPARPGGGMGTGVTVVGYDPDEFTSMTDDGTVSVRYRIEDGVGSTGYLNIHVYVSRNGNFDEGKVSYYRSISSTYDGAGPSEGGLSPDSDWREGTYRDSLSRAMTGENKSFDLRLSKAKLLAVRDYVGTNGFGNSESPSALRDFWGMF